ALPALVLYEHAITFGAEVQQVWKRDISGATLLFLLTRYITLLNRVFSVVGLWQLHSYNVCDSVLWLQAITTSVLIVVMSAIGAVRLYALWNKHLLLLILVMVTGSFPAFMNIYFRSASTPFLIEATLYTCHSLPNQDAAAVYMRLSLAIRIISILSDGLVVVLTWLKTYRVYLLTHKTRLPSNVSGLILRDGNWHSLILTPPCLLGTLYFLAVCALNALAVVYLMEFNENLLNDMIVSFSSILMTRFLLNLRSEGAQIDSRPASTAFTTPSMTFNSAWRAS
ncbi:uncharacterized protein BXZ73DRAFT_25635, partial [Epithele typhae]|uniref:uncharacterized protein n=1 Tax=Epithele typhae TaxID=378194 RepID=UPI0020089C2F